MRDLGSDQERQVTREELKIKCDATVEKKAEPSFQSLPPLGRVELGECVIVPQDVLMITKLKNANARTEPENVNAKITEPETANRKLTEPENVNLRATAPENLRVRTTELPIFESMGNGRIRHKRRDSVSSANILFSPRRDEKSPRERSPENSKLTWRYNLRQVPGRRAL